MMPLRALGSLSSPVVTAIGRPDVSLKCMFWIALIMIPAISVGTRWGLHGVAMAWALSYPLAYIASSKLVGNAVSLPLFSMLRPIIKPTACGIVMAVGVIYLDNVIVSWHYAAIRLGSLILAGVILYASSVLLVAREEAGELLAFATGLLRKK